MRRLRTLRQGMPGFGHRNRGESMKTRWYHYLWIWSILYFSLGFFNILFAWLGLISFFLPLVFAIGFGNKHFCNRYCDRGQLLRMLGSQRGFSRNHDMPGWMKSCAFRYGFLLFFLAMFANVLYATYLVAGGARDVQEVVTLFWTFDVPWEWAVSATASPWAFQFAYGFYSLMLTSALLGILTMLFYKPRSWCVYCPMGTMTQLICKAKAVKSKVPGSG